MFLSYRSLVVYVFTLVFAMLSAVPALSQVQPSVDRGQEKEAWFREARFGMFIHWGLFSAAGGMWDGKPSPNLGCWIQGMAEVDPAVYGQELIPKLTGERFDAEALADLAETAGMRYVVVVAKHHEGFCMFDSQLTDYTIMNAPAGQDWVGLTLDAMRQRGLRAGVYYSLFDWHHPQYPIDNIHPLRNDAAALAEPRDLDRYLDYMHAQVMELMTQYGPIDIFWPDFSLPHRQGEDWRATELMENIRAVHPDILLNNRLEVINQRGQNAMSFGANFFTPEQHIPPQGYPGQLFEVCQTINDTWGYTHYDRNWKTPRTLIHELVDTVSKGGNYLLNIGPKPDGSVPQSSINALEAVGEWMDVHGQSIYGTSASAYPEVIPWGRCTQKKLDDGTTRLYLHVFDWPGDQTLRIRALGTLVGEPWLLSLPERDELTYTLDEQAGEWVLTVPVSEPNDLSTVVVIDIDRIRD